MKQAPFPIISVEGGAYEIGYQYGSQCKKLIEEAIGVYRKLFKTVVGLEWEAAISSARKFTPYIEEYDSAGMEEMHGVAKGSGQAFDNILTLNLRYELVWLKGAGGLGECTALAVTPEASSPRRMLMAENWDLQCAVKKLPVLLKQKRKNGPNVIQLAEAGVIGRHGFNSAGVCVVANAMVSDGWQLGVPMQIILHKILNQESLVDAMGAVLAAKRASSGNYLIGYTGSEGSDAVDIEASPGSYNVLWPDNGMLAHANHFSVVNPEIKDLFPPMDPGSLHREHRATTLLAKERGNIDVDAIKKILRNHFDKKRAWSICSHADPKRNEVLEWMTIASYIFDLQAKTMHIAKGPPCENEYVALTFDDIMRA